MINLKNQRILVTREKSDATKFASEILKYGGRPITMPLLQICCLSSQNNQESLVIELDYEWVFFTSKNGVTCFLKEPVNESLLQKSNVKVAAVGSQTAAELLAAGYPVDFIPSRYNAEVMAEEFLTKYEDTGRTLFVRGVLASNILIDAFTKAKRQFECYEVYDTVVNTAVKVGLQQVLTEKRIDVLTFTSPSTVNGFFEMVEKPELFFTTPTVCIGTTTEKRAKEIGFTETIVPEVFTTYGMIVALSDYLKRERE